MVCPANTPVENSGLLLDDADDAPVPLVASVPASTVEAAGASTEAGLHLTLAHPPQVPARELQQAVDWVCSSEPYIGIRRWFLKATGINLGVSGQEQRLRSSFCVMYRALYDQTRRPQ